MLKYWLIKVYWQWSYSIKQHLTTYTCEILAHSGRGSLTANHSCPIGRIGVAINICRNASVMESVLSQRCNVNLFVRYSVDNYIHKKLHFRCLTGFLIRLCALCSKHINNYFHQIYLSDKSDTENELLR